jgi:TPP-dependent pyruvate/acetoin dehydrogenase alpha subunit
VDGRDAVAVWRSARTAVRRARSGHGPTFLVARVERLEGHFLGDPLMLVAEDRAEFRAQVGPLLRGLVDGDGAAMTTRVRSLLGLTRTIATARADTLRPRRDPLALMRRRVSAEAAERIEEAAGAEVEAAVAAATREVAGA